MKKILTLSILIIILGSGVQAQQSYPSSGITIGGTSNWYWHIYRAASGYLNQSLLFAQTGSASTETIRARLTHWGGLSLGTTSISGTDLLSVNGNARISGNLDNKGSLYLNNIANHAGLRFLFDNTTTNNGADVDLTVRTNSGSPIVDWYIYNWGGTYIFNRGMNDGNGATIRKQLFRIQGNGDIVVPDGDAIVDGEVNCEEVKVEVLDMPDYVFRTDYQLRTLKETKEFISKNKHLPEIPSEREILANGGVDLGDMNMLLLKKIEELTLYQIELLERLEHLESKSTEIEQLKKEVELLKSK